VTDNIPSDPEAEKAVLGAVLMDEASLYEAAEILTADDFYSTAHGDIFSAAIGLAEENAPSDLTAVSHFMRQNGTLERCGGTAYIFSLIDAIPDVAHVMHYANIVKSMATKRRLMALGMKIVNGASSDLTTATDVLDKAQAGLMEISVGSEKASERGVDVADRVLRSFDGDAVAENRTEWPLESISRLTGGIGAGQLVISAGRPKTGKSALGVQMALKVAQSGAAVHFASLEMISDEVMQRVLSMSAHVNLSKIMHHACNADEKERLAAARKLLEPVMWIDDRPGQTLLQIRSQARKTQMRHGGLGLIVVDYLTLMGGRQKGWSREETVSANAQGLKNLAKDLGCPVLVLAQLNRSPDKENRKPRLSDLRESGAIEQAADIVLLIHRDAERQDRKATIIVAAQRHGPTGICDVIYEGEHTSFFDADPWEGMK
jgi:replicative DNA helicase